MQIELPHNCDLQGHAASAGFASISDYLMMLVERYADRESERTAIREGVESMRDGDVQSLEDFDREFRVRHNLPPRR